MSLSIPKPGFVSFFDLLPKQAFDSAIDLLYCMCRERYDQSEVKKVAFNYDLTVIINSIGHRKLPIYPVVWTRDQCNESVRFTCICVTCADSFHSTLPLGFYTSFSSSSNGYQSSLDRSPSYDRCLCVPTTGTPTEDIAKHMCII